MRKILFLLGVFVHLSANCQVVSNLNSTSIYLFGRSTSSKHNIIATDFNMKDSLLTHIGIGYYEDNEVIIFNMSPTKTDSNGSNLIKENLAAFTNYDDIKYHAVYQIKALPEEVSRLKIALREYSDRNIKFDPQFILADDDEMYCSEFVAKILTEVNPERFIIKPRVKNLNNFYSNVLKVSNFNYIPVDFFLDLPDVRIVSEKFY